MAASSSASRWLPRLGAGVLLLLAAGCGSSTTGPSNPTAGAATLTDSSGKVEAASLVVFDGKNPQVIFCARVDVKASLSRLVGGTTLAAVPTRYENDLKQGAAYGQSGVDCTSATLVEQGGGLESRDIVTVTTRPQDDSTHTGKIVFTRPGTDEAGHFGTTTAGGQSRKVAGDSPDAACQVLEWGVKGMLVTLGRTDEPVLPAPCDSRPAPASAQPPGAAPAAAMVPHSQGTRRGASHASR